MTVSECTPGHNIMRKILGSHFFNLVHGHFFNLACVLVLVCTLSACANVFLDSQVPVAVKGVAAFITWPDISTCYLWAVAF